MLHWKAKLVQLSLIAAVIASVIAEAEGWGW
jgi:hypothetical protein